ncbi:MAG: T9SS type A sorting domain-containing protein [Paludibacter sp.]
MKLNLLGVLGILILGFSNLNAQTHPDDRINLESQTGNRKGTILKISELDQSFNSTAKASNTLTGASIFTSWGTIEKTEGVYDWSYVDKLIADFKAVGKKVSVHITATCFSIYDTPDYLFSNYNLRRIVPGYWESFESTTDKGYILYGTKTTTNPIYGSKSLQMSTVNPKVMLETGTTHIFNRAKGITNPTYNPTASLYPTRPSPSFCLQFSYRANGKSTFSAKAYSISNPTNAPIETTWTAVSGESGTKTFTFTPLTDDYKVEIKLVSGNLTIDNINICDMVNQYYVGTLCFPNYFDPIFKTKYELFVKTFAERYNNDPAIDAIAVGGYGRWDEITISGDEPNVFEDQWTTFGFTNDNYVNHIKWCMDTYKKYFTNKNLFSGTVGWNTESWRDQNYIDWKVGAYAARNGIGIKYNGWQAMCTEWGSISTGFQYLANRYKYDKNVSVTYEEAGQINNTGMSEIMGHPISLFNKAMLDNNDYLWLYPEDLSPTYINRYQHYANEMAGSALITKLYNQFSRNDYYSPKAMKIVYLKNIWMGLFQKDLFTGTNYTYLTVNGQKAVQTNANADRISMSVDDRLKYSGMYGGVLTFDYFDLGTDKFKVYGKLSAGLTELATVTKTNTSTWKTFSIKDTGWTSKSANGGADDLIEIEVADMNDGVETLKSMEINYVPANDWQESVVFANDVVANKQTSLTNTYTYDFMPLNSSPFSSIAVNVSGAATGYVNITATVTAVIFGQTVVVANKEYYMPGVNDWFYIPLANGMNASSYRLTLKATTGTAYVNLGADNKLAVRIYSFVTEPGDADVDTSINEIEALKPFCMLTVQNKGNGALKLKKRMPDGSYLDMCDVVVYSSGKALLEPQASGTYRLVDANKQVLKAIPTYLKRLPVSRLPFRNVVGNKIIDFKSDSALLVVSGLKKIVNDNFGFHARLNDVNPVLMTTKALNLTYSSQHQLHFVMKNETGSSLAKLYWKTDKTDFSEANAALLPIVPNDEQYREYCYPIGIESTWRDKIVALKFIPVFGHTDAGKIHISAFDIRRGTNIVSKFDEPLLTSTTDFSIYGLLEVTNFKLEDGSGFAENRQINVINEVSGRVPTDYLMSEKPDFSNASWQPYQPNFLFLLSNSVGQKTLYFKVKDNFGESNTVNASIFLKTVSAIDEPQGKQSLRVFPNPVKSFVKFECTDNESESFNVSIMSLVGVVYEQLKLIGNFTLNLSNYPKGALLVRIENKNRITQKIIIKN